MASAVQLAAFDHGGSFGSGGLDRRRLGCYGDLVGDIAEFEFHPP